MSGPTPRVFVATSAQGFTMPVGTSMFSCQRVDGGWIVVETDERGVAQTAHLPMPVINAMFQGAPGEAPAPPAADPNAFLEMG